MKLSAVMPALVPVLVLGTIGPMSVTPARADDAPPPIATLLANPSQLAAWLAARDPEVESARAHREAADAATLQTRVLPNPQLSVTTGGFVIGATNSGSGESGSSSPRLGLGQTTNVQVGVGELIEIGKRGHRQAAADLRAREAGEQIDGALGMRIGEATASLGHLAYVAAKRDVVVQNLAASRKLRDLEKNRLDNKDLSALEYARIELDTDQLERELGRAEGELAGALAACSAVLYGPCSPVGLDSNALDAAAPLPATLPQDGAIDSALEDRPARRAVKLEADALGEDAELARARRIPDPTIGVSYMLDNLVVAGNQHQQLLFSVGIPLPFFDRGDHDAAAARATAHAAIAQDRAEVRQARGAIDGLVAQRAALEATLAKLETDAVPKSTQIIDQTRKAFDLGQARLADLLLVERAHRDLLLEVLDTRSDLFTVRAQLRQALGLDDQVARQISSRSK